MATDIKPHIGATAARWGYAVSMGGTLISRLATLAILILLPKQIGLTDYGMFALVITLGEIIEMTSSNWYRVILVRQSVNPDTSGHSKSPSILQMVGLCLLIAIVAAAFASPVVASERDLRFGLAVIAYIIAFASFRLLVTVLQAQGSPNLVGVVEMIRGAMTLCLVMSLVIWGESTFVMASFGLIGGTFASVLLGLPAIRGKGLALLRQRLEHGTFASIGIPIILATILTYQLGWLDRLVIQHWLGPQLVGLYVAVIAVARQPIDLVLNSLNTQTFPLLMTRGESERDDGGKKVAGILVAMCILGAGTASAIIALEGPLLKFALPAFDQHIAGVITPLITIGTFTLGIKHFVFDNIFHAYGRNWVMLRWFALISFATLAVSLFAVPRYGAPGAAACFAVGASASLLSSILLSRQFCRLHWPIGALVRVFLCAVLAGVSAYLAIRFSAAPWIRLLVGAATFGIVYFLSLKLILGFRLKIFLAAPWNIDGIQGNSV